jgi:hypothetical protein
MVFKLNLGLHNLADLVSLAEQSKRIDIYYRIHLKKLSNLAYKLQNFIHHLLDTYYLSDLGFVL